MDMARVILEGIHEVELQVTPEFQKPEKPKPGVKSDLFSLENALNKNGWKLIKGEGDIVAPDVYTMVWGHPDLADVAIGVTYDWKTDELIKDTISVEGGAEPGAVYPATPETVKRLTDELKSVGVAKGGAVSTEEWPEPKRVVLFGMPRIDYEWADKATVRGVRVKAHPGSVYAISWPKSSFGLQMNWGAAIRAIKKLDEWDKVYVYGVPEHAMKEFNDLVWEGLLYAAFYPGGGNSSDYDANVVDMLKEYMGHEET